MASIPVIALESSKPNVNRRSANYHPSVWGDYFLTRASDFQIEKEREHVISVIECYKKQYGATEEEAIREFNRQVEDAWKDINEECLYPTAIPMPLLIRILNLTRVINVLYKNEDGYTISNAYTKNMVSSLLVDPVEDN